MNEEDVPEAQRAQELYAELTTNEPRSVLLWLCSYLRRWDYQAWNFTPDEVAAQEVKAAAVWNSSTLPN